MPAVPAALPADDAVDTAVPAFTSSFEAGDRQPDWIDVTERADGVEADVRVVMPGSVGGNAEAGGRDAGRRVVAEPDRCGAGRLAHGQGEGGLHRCAIDNINGDAGLRPCTAT